MSEFDRIDDIVRELGQSAYGEGVVLGPGDDAAVLSIPADHELVVSADTLVAGRHYPEGSDPELIAGRAMGVSLSDLAAMGATPRFVTVSLATETLERDWAIGFGRGLARRAREYEVSVVGGNIARGPQHVAVTVHGIFPRGRALRRSAAQPGDDVWVTGMIGHAASALAVSGLDQMTFEELQAESNVMAYWNPPCRAAFGGALRELATAAIDISDGLASDLMHVAEASGVRIVADLDRTPTSPGMTGRVAITAGDDYELAFTASGGKREAIESAALRLGVPVARIGEVESNAESGASVAWLAQGRKLAISGGYRHF